MNQELHSDGDDGKHQDGNVDHEARRLAGEAQKTAERAELKVDGVEKRLDRIDTDIKDGFKESRGSITRIHERIDNLTKSIKDQGEATNAKFNKILLGTLGLLIVIILEIILTKAGLL